MQWEAAFFNKRVEDEILAWPEGILAKFTHIVELIEHYGPFELGMPKIENFGQGLLQIRSKGKEGIGRAFFCLLPHKRILILHGFIKKTKKTPPSELKTALKRMKEVKNE